MAQHVNKMMISSTKTSKLASTINIHSASIYSNGPTLIGETSLSINLYVLSSDVVTLFSLVALSLDVVLLPVVSLATGSRSGFIDDVSFLMIS